MYGTPVVDGVRVVYVFFSLRCCHHSFVCLSTCATVYLVRLVNVRPMPTETSTLL